MQDNQNPYGAQPQAMAPQQGMPQQQYTSMPQQTMPGQTNPQFAGQMTNAQMPNAQMPGAQPQTQPKQIKQDQNSTQGTLLFSELRDSMVIMKDGSFRAVVACKSINFDLMAETEREGVEMSYQDFLNSINFSIQILVRSQRIDIRPYIEKLEGLRRNEDNMLLARLMDNYIDFIDELSQEANIMDKSFFVIIPYYSSKEAEHNMNETKNFFKALNRNKSTGPVQINRDVYDKATTEMNHRCDAVIQGLYSIGINAVRLNTEALGHLFYSFNNPSEAIYQPMRNFNDLAQLYVKKATPEEAEAFRQQQMVQQGGQQ